MPIKGYTTVALPNNLIDQVDKVVKIPENGYVSRPEFIKEAIREKIQKIKP